MSEVSLKYPRRLCSIIGCSSTGVGCPGNLKCDLLLKITKERPDLVEIANDY